MMSRCYNINDKDYSALGGSGITVDSEWHDFKVFLGDLGERPDNCLMKRLDLAVGFIPGNVVWEEKIDVKRNRLYSVWKSMKRRCAPEGMYGRLGIWLSPVWQDSFVKFQEDVGSPPSDGHTLERIENKKGYYPGNVRWALPKEQANNREDNIRIQIDGENLTLQEWCDMHGLDRGVVSHRSGKLFAPTGIRSRKVEQVKDGEVVGVYVNAKEAAASSGIGQAAIQKCLCGGNKTSGGFEWRYKS